MAMSLFSREEFHEIWGSRQLSLLLVSQDTYDEKQIYESIKKISLEICAAIGIQLSIVGFGNKSYGLVNLDNKMIEIKEFFGKNNISWSAKFGDKVLPETLTPRRLIRFFRYLIQDYLIQNPDKTSYLYRKYCFEKNELLRQWIFPGVEHILKPEQKDIDKILIAFIQSYITLDQRLNTKIYERILRVLYARGFTPEYMRNALIEAKKGLYKDESLL